MFSHELDIRRDPEAILTIVLPEGRITALQRLSREFARQQCPPAVTAAADAALD